MKRYFSDSSITTDEFLDAIRTQYETAQKMLTPLAEERIPPFDALHGVLKEDYEALLNAFYRFRRDIAAIDCYGHDIPPLEFEIFKRHSDDDTDLQEITNQVSDWLYAYSVGDENE